jgi:choline dehydrogenase-like flavoprotein
MSSTAKFKTTDTVDFLIVGSGSAGGVLAKELSSNGFQVVVLEQGPRIEAGPVRARRIWSVQSKCTDKQSEAAANHLSEIGKRDGDNPANYYLWPRRWRRQRPFHHQLLAIP